LRYQLSKMKKGLNEAPFEIGKVRSITNEIISSNHF
jgi:hypothetical protein